MKRLTVYTTDGCKINKYNSKFFVYLKQSCDIRTLFMILLTVKIAL